ncbi:MAG: hypothetical protein H0V06_07155 [Gemmatimonadetes bacterium]|nr:hypothetical protein [Gemmatimonadota bacterium]
MRPVRLPLGRHPRRTSAHDDQIVERRLGLGAQAEVLGQLLIARVRQVRAVPEQQQGQTARGSGTQLLGTPTRIGVALVVQPLVRNAAACQKVAHLV